MRLFILFFSVLLTVSTEVHGRQLSSREIVENVIDVNWTSSWTIRGKTRDVIIRYNRDGTAIGRGQGIWRFISRDGRWWLSGNSLCTEWFDTDDYPGGCYAVHEYYSGAESGYVLSSGLKLLH